MKQKKKPVPRMIDPRDAALGARIREVCESADPKVTQLWLARDIRVTMQQVHKYLTGENRIAWSRLCDIADVLDISVVELIEPLFKK
jgi:transcriptional regulator with XRE-family HTH domain